MKLESKLLSPFKFRVPDVQSDPNQFVVSLLNWQNKLMDEAQKEGVTAFSFRYINVPERLYNTDGSNGEIECRGWRGIPEGLTLTEAIHESAQTIR